MKKLANLTGVKILGKNEQKSIHGGSMAFCSGTCTGANGTKCKYPCNGSMVQGLCFNGTCVPI